MRRKQPPAEPAGRPRRTAAGEVFLAFLQLGLTSFGGPVAHLGYFRTAFVQRRQWLDDARYSELVALCQFLPGPTSSQVGMALGLRRAGWWGALAAWVGFTLPSAVAMVLFGYGVLALQGMAQAPWVHGLKVAAVAVVAQAVWGMARTLCPDRTRAAFAVVAAVLVWWLPSPGMQVAAMGLCALGGRWLLHLPSTTGAPPHAPMVSRRIGLAAWSALALLLLAWPAWLAWRGAGASGELGLVSGVMHAGALVFGGGHVVLPLLHSVAVPSGWVPDAAFVAGYGAAQALPGPLFSFAAFVGTVAGWPLHGWAGGAVLLVAIFVPAFLLLVGALPFWDAWRARPGFRAAVAGVNAGVVGILMAALVDPVWVGTIHTPADFALALVTFALLVVAKVPPIAAVLFAAIAGWALAALG